MQPPLTTGHYNAVSHYGASGEVGVLLMICKSLLTRSLI